MSYVQVNFPLPTITGKDGSIMPYRFTPGRCALNAKKGISGKGATPTIRKAMPRARLTLVHRNPKDQVALGNFFDSLLKIGTGVTKGIVTGAAGGPVGMVAGGIGGGISSGLNAASGKGKQSAPAVPQQPLGPLAGVSTGTIVGIGLGFSALIIVLARGGR